MWCCVVNFWVRKKSWDVHVCYTSSLNSLSMLEVEIAYEYCN